MRRARICQEQNTHMRHLITDSALADVVAGKRSVICLLVSGESIGHRSDIWAYKRLKNASVSVVRW